MKATPEFIASPVDMRAMCVHEAAHAVVCLAVGGRVKYMQHFSCNMDLDGVDADSEQLVNAAGWAAETILDKGWGVDLVDWVLANLERELENAALECDDSGHCDAALLYSEAKRRRKTPAQNGAGAGKVGEKVGSADAGLAAHELAGG